MKILIFVAFIFSVAAFASDKPMGPDDCGDMESWDYSMGMCMPVAMPSMPMSMLMVHGNSFFVQNREPGPRGRNEFSVPNMFMVDYGKSFGSRHYVNLDYMGTLEKWTIPTHGNPEFFQIGEENGDGVPFIDAQHPHSSPIMGLTLSDTVSFGPKKDYFKFWFAPRGQSTDGPIAFMHRPTGMINPDTPLGHHIGQDVGHISSTVIGASVKLSNTTIEASTFHGEEPKPTKVDLPLGNPNSYGLRVTETFNAHLFAMVSVAYAKNPEPDEPNLDHVWRYSASIYDDNIFDQGWADGWMIHNALIWGMIKHYDNSPSLNSFAEEFWIHKNAKNIWGRLEVLQRTPHELAISGVANGDAGQWIEALTLGYTYRIYSWENAELGLGGSLTKDFLPDDFKWAYGGQPLSGKVFLQLSGMKMWDL